MQTFENLKAALAAVGARFQDVVKLNNYLDRHRDLPILREVRDAYLRSDAAGEHDACRSRSCARAGALLEVEAVAVLPPPARSKPARGEVAAQEAPGRALAIYATKTKVSSAKTGSSTATTRTCSRRSSAS